MLGLHLPFGLTWILVLFDPLTLVFATFLTFSPTRPTFIFRHLISLWQQQILAASEHLKLLHLTFASLPPLPLPLTLPWGSTLTVTVTTKITITTEVHIHASKVHRTTITSLILLQVALVDTLFKNSDDV